MEMFTCPFLISVEFAVRTGVSVSAGVVVCREGVTAVVEEFVDFVPLMVGVVHPATRTHPTIMKNVRNMNFFIGTSHFLPEDDPFLIVIFYQLGL
jgi:hypothetical protein